jgi:hypothetical protein
MLEKEVENYLVWCVERLGGRAYKFASPNNRGVSDRIVCLPDGQTWFIEMKRPKGGRLSPLQQIFAGEMVMLNQQYACLWTKEQVDEWIARVSGTSG